MNYLRNQIHREILTSLSLKADLKKLTDDILKAKTRLELLEIGQILLKKLQLFLEIQENIRYYQLELKELSKTS